jgi:hypothetical protein
MNFDRLRFVAERAELGEQREAVLAVTIPNGPAATRRCARSSAKRSVTEFNYRYAPGREGAHLPRRLGERREETERLIAMLRRNGVPAVDLSDNEMAKLHGRHLVGGRARLQAPEMLYRFEFPERPGALMNFLQHMGSGWNISLFHYRNHGADVGRVLVGMQVPAEDRAAVPALPARPRVRLHGRVEEPGLQVLLEVTLTPPSPKGEGDLHFFRHVSRRAVGSFAEEILFHLLLQVLARARVGAREAVSRSPASSGARPALPRLLRDASRRALAELAGIRREIEALGLALQLHAVHHPRHRLPHSSFTKTFERRS